VLERQVYEELGLRTRYQYVLTEKGHKLFPVLVALMQWGDEFLADPAGPAIEVEHAGCGATVHAELRCADDHEIRITEVGLRPGPGAIAVA
jgi:hypothetical protein